MSAQLFLFDLYTEPAAKVRLHRPCEKCDGRIGMVGPGKGPHAGELRCQRCLTHSRWITERERQIIKRVSSSPHAPEVILLPPRGQW